MTKKKIEKEETIEERLERLRKMLEEEREPFKNWTKEQKAKHLLDKMSS